MPDITKNSQVMKKKINLIIIIISTIFSINIVAQEQQLLVTVVGGIEEGEYEDIQYRGIEVNQIVDFTNLIRVYINKSSVIMVNLEPVTLGKTKETIKDIFIADVDKNYGSLTKENIGMARCKLKLLVRKSTFTKRADYREFMKMVNGSVWELQKYYSNKVYNKEYPELTQYEKDKVNKLVPLKNLLAKDNTD